MMKLIKFFKNCIKKIKPSILAVILLLGVTGFALFAQPLLGLADNGDFYRVMVSNDIKHEADRDINDYFGYFNHSYDKIEYYNELHNNFITTQSIIVRSAMVLDDLFTWDDQFDIRFSAALCLLVLAYALYLLVESAVGVTQSRFRQYIIAFLAVVIFGDIGYTTYFNSFFGEAVAYPFFLLSIAAMLRFSSCEKGKMHYIVLFFIATFFFIGSKNQFAANGLLAFVLLFGLIFAHITKKQKIISVSLGVVLVACTVFFYLAIDSNISLINKYHMITRGVQLYEADPGEVTKEVGLNSQYSMLSDSIYFDSMPVIDPKDPLLLSDFYPRYNLSTVTLYYFEHPNAFAKIMELGLKNSFSIRTDVLGNYERSSGREYGEKTSFFAFWSTVKENHTPHTSGIIYMLLLVSVIFSINRITKYRKQQTGKEEAFLEVTLLYVVLTAFSQILVSLIGAGDTDLRKHLFITTVSLDLLFFYNLAYGLSLIPQKGKNKS